MIFKGLHYLNNIKSTRNDGCMQRIVILAQEEIILSEFLSLIMWTEFNLSLGSILMILRMNFV